MAQSTSEMKLSGGHPALDLANSVDSRRGRWGPDLLRSFDDLLVLAERTGLLDGTATEALRAQAAAHPGQARAALADAVRLREAIYEVFLAEDAGQDYPAAALATVRAAAEHGRRRQRLSLANGGFAWALPFDELGDVAAAFALGAADLLTGRVERRAVRECKGDNCGWLFLDRSKGGRRMWCSDASCGTHNRVKRFRRRDSTA
jgi:predicted RNA-binding Zn ribbon-like protein